MTGGDYLLALLAIITGLAISDLVVSLHELLLNRRNVRWDWLSVLAAAYIFLLIVVSWAVSYGSFHDVRDGEPIWSFVITLWQLIPIYLAARAIFPDNLHVGTTVDLAAHYAFVSRYVWTALLTTLVFYVGLSVIYFGPTYVAVRHWDTLIGIALCLALALWQNRRLHVILVPLLFAWLCVFHIADRLVG